MKTLNFNNHSNSNLLTLTGFVYLTIKYNTINIKLKHRRKKMNLPFRTRVDLWEKKCVHPKGERRMFFQTPKTDKDECMN